VSSDMTDLAQLVAEAEAEAAADAGLIDKPLSEDDRRFLVEVEATYRAGRRDVPTGTVIARLDPATQRERWLRLRRTGIGSSDVAALLGVHRYKSEKDIWLDKRGEAPLEDKTGEAALWGNLFEDVVAREWARRNGVQVRRIGTIANRSRRHLLCDLDRVVIGCTLHSRCALEVKTRNAYVQGRWSDGVVDDVYAQVQQQLAVTGIEAVHTAVLFGGQQLEQHDVYPDPAFIEDMLLVADRFWTENVLGGAEPVISSLDFLVAELNKVAPEKGTPVVVDDPIDQMRVQSLTERLDAIPSKREQDQMKAELKALIGDKGTDLVVDGKTLWTWRPQKEARRLDVDRLREDHPDVVEAYTPTRESLGTTRVLKRAK
jgi:putative phage-type endonuclease